MKLQEVATPSRRAGRVDAGGPGTDPVHMDLPVVYASTPAETLADATCALAAERPRHCKEPHVSAYTAPYTAVSARRTTGPVGLAWQGTHNFKRQAREGCIK